MNLARAQKVKCAAEVNAACGKESTPGCCAREAPLGDGEKAIKRKFLAETRRAQMEKMLVIKELNRFGRNWRLTERIAAKFAAARMINRRK